MRTRIVTTLMLLAPRVALACPVCFGQNDSPLAKAMNLGIIAMLGVVAAVLVSFASFFIYLMRRAKLAEQIEPAQAGHDGLRNDPQEGTVQC